MSKPLFGLYLTPAETRIVKIGLKMAFNAAKDGHHYEEAQEVLNLLQRVPDADEPWREGEI